VEGLQAHLEVIGIWTPITAELLAATPQPLELASLAKETLVELLMVLEDSPLDL